MNIYNIIGLAQNCDSNKINNRLEKMLEYYNQDVLKLANEYQIEKDIFEKDKLNFNQKNKLDKILGRMENSNHTLEELKKAKVLFSNTVLRIEYDNFIKQYPKATLSEFFKIKKINVVNREEDDEGEEKINLIFKNGLENNCTIEEIQRSVDEAERAQRIQNSKNEQNVYKTANEIEYLDSNNKISKYLMLNFNPNQSNLYQKNIVRNLEYCKYLNNEEYEIYLDDEKVKITIIGKLNFETTCGIKDLGLYNYRIEKANRNKEYDKNRSYNIFSGINIKRLSEDEDYRAYIVKILLSETNMEAAINYNGGYVGEVEQLPTKEFYVYHQQERLCATLDKNFCNTELKYDF